MQFFKAPFLKKHTKSRQPFEHLESLGNPSHISITSLDAGAEEKPSEVVPKGRMHLAEYQTDGVVLNISAGLDDAGDPQTTQRSGWDRRSHGNDITRGGDDGPAAVQERDGDQRIPPTVSGHEQFVLSVSDLPVERGPAVRDYQEAVFKRPTGIPPEQTSGDHVGGASGSIRLSQRECKQLRNALNINLLQLWAEPRRVASPGRLPPLPTGGFHSLKTLLSDIRKVCVGLTAQSSRLTNSCTGCRIRRRKYR